MIDHRLRVVKDRALGPVAARLPAGCTPARLTLASLACGVSAGVLASTGARWWALAAWLLGRVLDGLDGAVARRTGRQSDLGGFLDLVGDAVGYVAVPLGVAAGQGDRATWIACAVLLASFYVNAVAWLFLAAVAERRDARGRGSSGPTAVHMPAGLVEGAETIVLYALMLALPTQARPLFWAMAVLVTATIVQRVIGAGRRL